MKAKVPESPLAPAPVRRAPSRSRGETERRLWQAELLLELSRKVAALESLDEVLNALVEITTRELGAERGTLFLNDPATNELYSRVAQGDLSREIRILNNSGISGHVFQSGEGVIIHDAYSDERFNRSIDERTGFQTKSILCVPIHTIKGVCIGAAQVLNKKEGQFSQDDLELLAAMTTQAAVALQSAQFIEQVGRTRTQEMAFLDMIADLTSEIDLSVLLRKVMGEATRMLQAERSTLFLNDAKTSELFSTVGEGVGAFQIRLPNHLGIAGTVFTSGQTVNIPYAYADLRFNPAFDKKTGFFTRSILCVPVVNKLGVVIGVTQCLNKRGGPFTDEDEQRLKAFTAQVSIALENAKLFDDVRNMKNYNESMLQSMTNGVITLDEEDKIVTCNEAAMRILKSSPGDILNHKVDAFFEDTNPWLLERLAKVKETGVLEVTMDAELVVDGEKRSVNSTVLPLVSTESKGLGNMIMIEDISSEKRMKSTMARYMDPGVADQLLAGGDDFLGGKSLIATVLFTDIRGFTTLTEELGPQGTVSFLNEYFSIMVECISSQGGMLDKFIGDAIMAAFGIPEAHDDDEDRALRAAIKMITSLRDWNRERLAEGKKPVDMGIGLNTDSVVSGNIGSPKRMDFTIIGDGVNLAARLESACKQYKARILISENTARKLKNSYRMRGIDLVVVKGKTQPVEVIEVLDYHTEETFPNLMEVVGFFKHGVDRYRAGQWDKAIAAFGEALKANPADFLSQMYIDRCEVLKTTQPEGPWDGIWVMKEK